MIKAKSIVPDQYWILTDSRGKIGNIQAQDHGFKVTMQNSTMTIDDLAALAQTMPVQFESTVSSTATTHTEDQRSVHGYPVPCLPHNAVWDLRRRIPLWTRDAHSRSWLAAGWYRVRLHRTWKTVLCPKTILLDRYPWQGPYHDQQEADSACCTSKNS